MTSEEYEKGLIDRCFGVLRGELAEDLSDAELTRCLAPCVAGDRLVELMQRYREGGGLIPSRALGSDDLNQLRLMGKDLPYWAGQRQPAQQDLFAA